MLRHSFKNTDNLNLEIGIPCTLKISGSTDKPEIIVNASPDVKQHMDFKVKENGKGCHVSLRDRCNGKTAKMNCDIIVHLPKIPLENLLIKAVCGKIKIEDITLHKLDVNNVEGRLKICQGMNMEQAHLTLVSCESEVCLGNAFQTGRIKAIESKTRINADGFNGICDINSIGAETRVNDITIHNGQITTGKPIDGKKISCEIISGRFFIDGISV